MKIFRIEKIVMRPMIVLAHSDNDAADIFGYGLSQGLGDRPDADFDIVRWRPKANGHAAPLHGWARQGLRGMAWSVDDDRGWELFSTRLEEP